MTAPTFPLEPLAKAAGVTLGQIGGQTRVADHDARHGYAELSELLAVSRTTLRKWRANGLTIDQADKAAMALGMLPHEVWDRWYPVTAAQGAAAVNAAKLACPQGHPYSHVDSRGYRVCRWCHTEKVRRIRANTQATRLVTPAEGGQVAC